MAILKKILNYFSLKNIFLEEETKLEELKKQHLSFSNDIKQKLDDNYNCWRNYYGK